MLGLFRPASHFGLRTNLQAVRVGVKFDEIYAEGK